jgi:3',5'-cyclic AMP phosphodiesterase CpdA
MRFVFVLIFISILVTNCQTDQGFRFVFMTDIHVQPELDADKGFEKAIRKVNSLKPDFVITGGDLIMDALGQSYERATMLYDLFSDACRGFTMPVYHTLGNHEIFGLYLESGIEESHPQFGKIMYKNYIGDGKTYFSFDHQNWHFIVLDAIGFTVDRQYIGKIDSLQLLWLKEDLKSVQSTTPLVVSLHIPLVSVYRQMQDGATAAFQESSVVTNSKEVLAAFNGYNLKLVLQGHLHVLEEIIWKDVRYITGGAVSGAWWKGPRDVFPEGFVVIDTKGESFSWKYETFGWKAVNDIP